MAIPDYQSIMLPLLILIGDSQEHSLRQAIETLSEQFNLTAEERKQLLPSGRQAVFDNRIGWARTYMKKAGLLESTQRGHFKITSRGRDVLEQNPPMIDVTLLSQFEEFQEFRTPSRKSGTPATRTEEVAEAETLEEVLGNAYQRLREELADELLSQIKTSPPSLFEKIVVELLVGMGYGGNLKDAGRAVGRSGDEGIDGVIKEDRLGLDVIYIQAKRWDQTVGRPEVQKFAGALQGQRARKGIFITTSGFSKEAQEYVDRIDSRIILVEGSSLAEFMIDHNIGVTPRDTYEVKKIDSDYFAE